jgi:ferredoxin-NADP reductase
MTSSRSLRRQASAALVALAFWCAEAAYAQSAVNPAPAEDQHSGHHPEAATAGAASSPAPAPAGSAMPDAGGMAGTTGMGEMMGGQMEGEHGGPTMPFFSRLIALPELNEAERHQLAREAQQRIHRGLQLVEQGSREANGAASSAQSAKAARTIAEGLALYRSGTAAQEALNGIEAPQAVALDWFREQAHLAPSPRHDAGQQTLLGLSPGHLLLMSILTLVSLALLALQYFRWRRVRELAASAGTAAGEASPIASKASAPSGIAEPPSPAPAAPASGLESSNSAPPGGAALRRPRPWSGVLRVAQIFRETPSVATFRLAEPASDRLPFDFLPGQFLQVDVEADDGGRSRRSYTIASSPTQRGYVELTVKREELGAVSRYLHDRVSVGDQLKVMGPYGSFTFTGSDADSIVLIAGGVGITPMMSVLRYLTDTAWPGEIFFVYGARSTEEFIFREELEQLERRHEKLHVFASMQRAPGTVWLGPEGPITADLLEAAVPDIASRRVHLCGPPGMMVAMKRILGELGVPDAQIHGEAFGPASLPGEHAPGAVSTLDPAAPVQQTASSPAAAGRAGTGEVAAATVTFSVSGVSAALPADQTVLEAAEGAGVEIPYSCRIGECGVCVTRLLEGRVKMAVETGLDPADKAEGYILACQAKSTGVPLVVEA